MERLDRDLEPVTQLEVDPKVKAGFQFHTKRQAEIKQESTTDDLARSRKCESFHQPLTYNTVKHEPPEVISSAQVIDCSDRSHCTQTVPIGLWINMSQGTQKEDVKAEVWTKESPRSTSVDTTPVLNQSKIIKKETSEGDMLGIASHSRYIWEMNSDSQGIETKEQFTESLLDTHPHATTPTDAQVSYEDRPMINSFKIEGMSNKHVEESPYKCPVCEYKCTEQSYLKSHMRTHAGDKPQKSSVLEYKCAKANDLTERVDTPKTRQPFRCSVCSSRYDKKWRLRKHILSCHGGNCAAFEYSSAKQLHWTENAGAKPFKCRICGLGCAYLHQFTEHMKTHMIKCSLCEYRGTLQRNLNEHMIVHHGEKPYKCSVCEYKYARTSELDKHMITHNGEKPFRCSKCDMRYKACWNLRKHMLKHHIEKSVAFEYNGTQNVISQKGDKH